MDQAARLRELVNSSNRGRDINIPVISVISGKGGVGKTTLVRDIYERLDNSFIVDCDVNSPYFWMKGSEYRWEKGYELFNGRNILKNVERSCNLEIFDYLIIDAGTGLNDINKHYMDKSKYKLFISSMENISILNTMNLMKGADGVKVLYIPTATDDDVLDMQGRVNKYSLTHLDNSYIMVCSEIKDVIRVLNRNR